MGITLKRETLIFLHRITLGQLVELLLYLSYLSSWKENKMKIRDNKGLGEGFTNYLRYYQTLGEEFHAAMSLQDFCAIKYMNIPRGLQ